MAKEKFDIVCEKLALKHGTSARKIKREMKIAIEATFKNPTKAQKAFQDTIPKKRRSSNLWGSYRIYCSKYKIINWFQKNNIVVLYFWK